jgi:transcriptional regulator with XRE-family HTH domain
LQSVPLRLKALKPKEMDFEPQTLGEHLKRCRLQRELSQSELARTLGVDASTILNWEKGYARPPVKAMPGILGFLRYDPSPEPKSLPELLMAKRRTQGWSIREAGQKLGVDPGTWGDWERGKVILYRSHRVLVARLLGRSIAGIDQEMRALWNRSHPRRVA